MIHLPQKACSAIGSLSLVGAAVCSYKAGAIIYNAARKESKISNQSWKDGVGALVDEAHSRFSRVSKEMFYALSWAVPAFCFAVITAGSLSPERNYFGSKTISEWTCLTCETPRRPNGSPDSSYSLGEEAQRLAAQLFPRVVDLPVPRFEEDPFGYASYKFLDALDRTHRFVEKFVPPMMFYGIYKVSKTREHSPLSTEGEKGVIGGLAREIVDEVRSDGTATRTQVFNAFQNIQGQLAQVQANQAAQQQVPMAEAHGNPNDNSYPHYFARPPSYSTPISGGGAKVVVNFLNGGNGNVLTGSGDGIALGDVGRRLDFAEATTAESSGGST